MKPRPEDAITLKNNYGVSSLRKIFIYTFCILFCSAVMANETEESNEIENLNVPPSKENEHKNIFDLMFNEDDKTISASNKKSESGTQDDNKVTISELNEGEFADIAVIKIIDRSIGKLYLLEVPVNTQKSFNGLTITAKKCWNPFETKVTPNSRAYLDISQDNSNLFSGWMIASSPSLSYLEHSKYDVSLKSCKNSKQS